MTKLCEMIMECRAIKGMGKLVLYGWASQLEEGRYAPSLETFSLSDMVTSAIRSFSERFPGRLRDTHVASGLELRGDPLLVELAMNNLIENALKYSPKDSPVSVTLSSEGAKGILFQVADQVILSLKPSRNTGLPNQLIPAAFSLPGVIRCAS